MNFRPLSEDKQKIKTRQEIFFLSDSKKVYTQTANIDPAIRAETKS